MGIYLIVKTTCVESYFNLSVLYSRRACGHLFPSWSLRPLWEQPWVWPPPYRWLGLGCPIWSLGRFWAPSLGRKYLRSGSYCSDGPCCMFDLYLPSLSSLFPGQWNKNSVVALAEDDDLHVGQHHQLHCHLSGAQHFRPQTGQTSHCHHFISMASL